MKRRNVENAKLRRAFKRNKISDGFCGGTLIYLKLLLIWALVIAADFLFQVRFEYLWMFWLLLRSIYDSFRYQGTAFSVFFVCVTITSDMVCFLFIPVQWLFFLASTYVWVQYVWNTDRGICVPTVSLWLLFVYVEASIRLRELKMVPFTLDLCRPFAAHCIGYPVVTLGFGVKSYVEYRLKLRKQHAVARLNQCNAKLLTDALPAEEAFGADVEKQRYLTSQSMEDRISNGCMINGSQQRAIVNGCGASGSNLVTSVRSTGNKFNNSDPSLPKKLSPSSSQYNAAPASISDRYRHKSADVLCDNQFGSSGDMVDDLDANDDDLETSDYLSNSSILDIIKAKLFNAVNSAQSDQSSKETICFPSPIWDTSLHDSDEESRDSAVGAQANGTNVVQKQRQGGGKNKTRRRCAKSFSSVPEQNQAALENVFDNDPNIRQPQSEQKEKVQDKDLYLSLESDMDKLKGDLRTSRIREQDLRNQLQQLTISDKEARNELQQLRQNNEQLQTRVQNLVRSRQQDKQNMTTMEKKLADEQKQRSQAEQTLQHERKQRKVEEATRIAPVVAKADCTTTCKLRRRELEQQLKQFQRDLQLRQEELSRFESELNSLRAYKEQNNVDILMSALSAMQEKTLHLEAALSAETRIKLDLFSALGEARRQLEIVQGKLTRMEQEAESMRQRQDHRPMVPITSADLTIGSSFAPAVSIGAVDQSQFGLLDLENYQTVSYMNAISGVFGDIIPANDYGMIQPVSNCDMTMNFPSSSSR